MSFTGDVFNTIKPTSMNADDSEKENNQNSNRVSSIEFVCGS